MQTDKSLKYPGTLYLTLTRDWFYWIMSGMKTSEFRQYKEYYIKRLLTKEGTPRQFKLIHMQNGYSKTSPWFIIECKTIEIINHICWGKVFEIKLGKIISSST